MSRKNTLAAAFNLQARPQWEIDLYAHRPNKSPHKRYPEPIYIHPDDVSATDEKSALNRTFTAKHDEKVKPPSAGVAAPEPEEGPEPEAAPKPEKDPLELGQPSAAVTSFLEISKRANLGWTERKR